MKQLTTKQKVIRTLGTVVVLVIVILFLTLIRLNGQVEVGLADVAAFVYILSIWFPGKENAK